MKCNNLGGGIVSFDNVIDIDHNFLKSYISWLKESDNKLLLI